MYNWYVYFIDGGGRVKIGYSLNPGERKAQLQTASANELRVLKRLGFETKDDAAYFERWLHGLFDAYKVRGEWFEFPDGLDTFWPYVEALWCAFRIWVENRSKVEVLVASESVRVCQRLYAEIDRLDGLGLHVDADAVRQRMERMEEGRHGAWTEEAGFGDDEICTD